MLGQVLVLYLLAGVAVAVAVYLTCPASHRSESWFQVATAALFWPLYLPLLLSQRSVPENRIDRSEEAGQDELATIIAHVNTELDGALQSLDGWAEDVLSRERNRLRELRSAWVTQAERIREIDRLLTRPEYNSGGDLWRKPATGEESSQRLRHSQQVIQENVDRLKSIRDKALADLLATLAWVRELVSMIHLAKFSGASAARAEELVAQIAAAVEGLSAVTWQEETACAPRN